MGGKKLLPCNLTEEEKAAAWEEFDGGLLTREEMGSVNEVLTHYLFYTTEKNGKERECICTHTDCGKFTVKEKDRPGFFRKKHGEETRCPRCGEIVNMVALGKMHTFNKLNDRKWVRVTLFRTGKDGALLMMSGYVKRYFCWEDLRPVPDISWKTYTYLKPGKRMQWLRTWEPKGQHVSGDWWWGYQWNPCEAVREPFNPGFHSYYGGGNDGDSYFVNFDLLGQSDLRYSQVEDWMYKEAGVFMDTGDDPIRNAVKYLSAYTAYPTLEMAVKLDLHGAATELAVDGKKNHRDLNWSASNINGFLRLNKQDAKAFVHHGGNLQILKAYHRACKAEITANMGEFISVLKGADCINLSERIVIACEKTGCSVKQAVNYIKKFPRAESHILTTWLDYLNMAQQLQYDMTRRDVTMPKDLQERHDAASETTRYQRIVIDEEKHRKYNEYLRKMYAFEYEDLCIVVPGTVEEIVQEGKTLQHCVAGYAARHFNNQLHILFLRHRRKSGVPFITIEIHTRKTTKDKVVIKQIHGYQNEMYIKPAVFGDKRHRARPEYKYKWFLDVWKKWVENGSKRDKKGNPVLPKEKEKTA